jgi:hypothetical protein
MPSPSLEPNDIDSKRQFRLNCRLLRNSGKLDIYLQEQKPGESLIDCLVRLGIAIDARAAAEALIVARRMQQQRDDVLKLIDSTSTDQLPENLLRMRNYERDGWKDDDWIELEVAAGAALWAGRELDDLIGSGGGTFGPKHLDEIILSMTSALRRLKMVQERYL